MMKLSIVLFVAALAFTSAKAFDDDDQQLGTDGASQPEFPFDDSFSKDFAGFKRLSADDVKNLKPQQPGEHVAGQFQSFSSSKKVVNGVVVKDEKQGESVSNHDGDVESRSYNN